MQEFEKSFVVIAAAKCPIENNPRYLNLFDEEKIESLKEAFSAAKSDAKEEVLEEKRSEIFELLKKELKGKTNQEKRALLKKWRKAGLLPEEFLESFGKALQ